MPMKTPGVYVVEKNAFPNSIVEVETAVPAFIGYTQKAEYKGSSLLKKPKEISSLNEFHEYFGYAPHPMFTMHAVDSRKEVDLAFAKLLGAQHAAKAVTEGDAQLASMIKTVNVVQASEVPNSPTDADSVKAIQAGIDAVADAANAQSTAEDVLAKIQSVVTAISAEPQQVENAFKQMLNDAIDPSPAVLRVTYSGKPYTFTQSNGWQQLYHGMRMFFANGGGKCYVVSVGTYEDDISKESLINGLTPLIKEQVPTMVVVPDAMQLSSIEECKDVQTAMLAHCGKMTNRIAILDVWEGWKGISEGVVQNFRENIGNGNLQYGAAYYPWLETSVISDRKLGFEHIENKALLVQVLEAELDTNNAKQKEDNEALFADIIAIKYNALELQNIDTTIRETLDTLNDTVRAQSQFYKNVIGELKDKLNLLPPSAAMAGIYTRVDNQRGVWKAPANVSVSMANQPSVNINHNEQETLNVDLKGKSINAIREFVGEGVMVWGARTLDGNSLDWRYINVRRTLIMLEQSTRLAARAFVFEPNTANTWVTMKSMISNFLTGIWKRGGLAGASPEDAFSVHIGLGETMTPEDILEGIMRITVLVAPSRPAEFIEITFQQQAQKS